MIDLQIFWKNFWNSFDLSADKIKFNNLLKNNQNISRSKME